ncbi:MAG: hypothetical protein AB8I08_32880 [Sandaracinaceae bacterium]
MRTFPLDKVRADGWLDQLGEGSQGFAQLCEVVGRNFVAFSVVAGIRITALTVDPRHPPSSVVEFEIGDSGGAQRLALSEFRDRLAQAMLSDDAPPPPPLSESPTAEDLQSYLGFRYVLLAPLYGIGLESLSVSGAAAWVTVTVDGEQDQIPLMALQERVRRGVQEELATQKGDSPFAIDLEAIPVAKAAAESADWETVVEKLGSWPGPLSVLLRTADGQALAPDVRAMLADALGMLGTAQAELGQHDWAQEILRLAIQWAQDQLSVSATLFRRLGAANMAQDRHGQAIGLLRRALALGAPKSEVVPDLAACFLARGRHVAALICAEEAAAVGVDSPELAELRQSAIGVLGDDWDRFRVRVRP